MFFGLQINVFNVYDLTARTVMPCALVCIASIHV